MNKLSKLWITIVMLLVTLPLTTFSQAQDKKVVVHIGQFSNDLHSVTMGLSVANMLQKKGADVTVFLDREGVRLADKTQKALIYADSDAEALYSKFTQGGGKVMVCPHCAEIAGLSKNQLRKGSTLGTPGSIAAMILEADVIIDY